jgi:hypothetical protein
MSENTGAINQIIHESVDEQDEYASQSVALALENMCL